MNFISQKPYIISQGCIWSWLMVHMYKRIISPGVFLYFFQILIFRINSGAKQQKMAWNYVRESTPYLSKHTSFDRVFCCTSLKWWHLQMLFSFFQNFGFLSCYNEMGWGGGRVEGQRIVQNDKTNLSHSVSQELYLIWLWFLVHMCKMMISPAFFFFFFFFSFLQNSDFRFFQSLSINAKRKLWDLPTFFTCVWFFLYFSSLQKGVYMECNKIFRSNVNFSY